MAKSSLPERAPAFNQSSDPSDPAFQQSECLAKLHLSLELLTKAQALSHVALENALEECNISQRYHYLAALDELIIAGYEMLDDAILVLDSAKLEKRKS